MAPRRPSHRLLLILLAVPFALVAIIAIGGAMLPEEHSVTRSITLAAPPDRVWVVISDVQNQPRWRSDLKSVTILANLDGQQHWEEHSSSGSIPYVLTDSETNRKRVIKIADPNLAFGGTWTMTLTPVPTGGGEAVGTSDVAAPTSTTLTITEDGTVHNIFFRFLARFVFGLSTTIEHYEHDLAKAVGSPPGVRPD
jgi:uncharacterized protein YndB with AHSA1/START domain